jgi:hypothetical protein
MGLIAISFLKIPIAPSRGKFLDSSRKQERKDEKIQKQ